MKRKRIEKVPFLPCGRIAKADDFYAAAAAVDIDGEEHLIVDIYGRKDRKTPLLRGAYKKTDWSIWYPKDGKWTRESIVETREGMGKLKAVEEGRRATVKSHWGTSGNISMRKGDIDKIFRFASGIKPEKRPWHRWDEELRSIEGDVKAEQLRRHAVRMEKAMEERHADTPPVPEAFNEWLRGKLSGCGFLFYRKKAGKAEVRCSRCGEDWTGSYKLGESYESQFRKRIEEPVKNGVGRCPYCGKTSIYKPAGHAKGLYGISAAGYLIQPYRGSGIVLREFMAEKLISLEEKEKISVSELSRAYLLDDREQVDWHISGFSGDHWSYQNIGGISQLKMHDGPVWRPSWDMIRDTAYGHSGCREYLDRVLLRKEKNECPRWYLWNYGHKPYMEMLAKRGMWHLVEASLSGYDGIIDPAAGAPEKLLGIYPYRMKLLVTHEGDLELLRVLQAERRQGLHMKEEQIVKLWMLEETGAGIEEILRFMGLQRFINRVEKYAGAPIEAKTKGIAARIAQTYVDYMAMQEATGADMTDQIIQHPRDLQAEHDKLVLAANEQKSKAHMEQKEAEFRQIAGDYRRLSRRLRYERNGLMIRPARSASEIIREGQILHHCVGGDRYLRRHDRGESYILFLRAEELPEVPYVTVEIDAKKFSVRQWYGVRDTKPDKERVDAWLDEYIAWLHQCEEAKSEAEVLLTAAG